MTVYLAQFFSSLLLGISNKRFTTRLKNQVWIFFGFILSLIIGFRKEIGVDWEAYLRHFEITKNENLFQILFTSDFGYVIVNWVVSFIGGEIYWVNFICALIFCYGLLSFCKEQSNSSVALITAIPVLILIVGMSYTRQSVAVGFQLLGFTALINNNLRKCLIYFTLATLFHKSAIVLFLILPFFIRFKFKIIISGLLVTIVLIFIKFGSQYSALLELYFYQKLSSDGGFYRILLNLIPAICILSFPRKYCFSKETSILLKVMSFAVFILLPIWFILPTATDRIFIYLIPLQIVFWSNLKYWFRLKSLIFLMNLGIICSYLILMIIWLIYGNYSDYWIPYKTYLLGL